MPQAQASGQSLLGNGKLMILLTREARSSLFGARRDSLAALFPSAERLMLNSLVKELGSNCSGAPGYTVGVPRNL